MTKAELIAALEVYPDDMIIRGYLADDAYGDRECELGAVVVLEGETPITLWLDAVGTIDDD